MGIAKRYGRSFWYSHALVRIQLPKPTGFQMTSLEDIGQAVGLKPGETTSILAEVRQNRAKLSACTRHQFRRSEHPDGIMINKRFTCANCGGTMNGEKITYYAEGVVHAGSPFLVWLE